MAATGTTVSEVVVEAVGIRCPIGDCKTVAGRPALGSALVAGMVRPLSNLLVVALQDAVLAGTALVSCAYEIPALQIGPTYQVKPRAADTWVVGQRLGFIQVSEVMCIMAVSTNCIGYTLEAKAANASECLIHFKGNTEADYATSA